MLVRRRRLKRGPPWRGIGGRPIGPVISLDLLIETRGRALLGVDLRAKIRRLRHVEGLSQREIRRRGGVHPDTIRRALASPTPPNYAPWRCGRQSWTRSSP